MRTKMIWTQIWDDEWYRDLNSPSKYLFLFLLTNPEANLIGIYRINKEKLRYYTKLTDSQLDTCFKDLQEKVVYQDGWIIIRKYQEYNPYKGDNTEIAKGKEMDLVPQNIKEIAESIHIYPPPMGDREGMQPSTNTNTNTIPITNGDVKGKLTEEELQEICDKYNIPMGMVKLAKEEMDNWLLAKGKRYKDYKAGLRNWVLRNAKQTVKEVQHESRRVSIDEIRS